MLFGKIHGVLNVADGFKFFPQCYFETIVQKLPLGNHRHQHSEFVGRSVEE